MLTRVLASLNLLSVIVGVFLPCFAFCFACRPQKMNTALLEQTYDDNVYGAVSFRQADSSTGTYDYTVHVSEVCT